jgi:hypothetical protein
MLIDRLESDRRGVYRVRPVALSDLRMALECDGVHHAPDQIGDITVKGVSVRFLAGRGPQLTAGARFQVALSSPKLDGPARVSVRVVAVAESPNSRLARLEFEETEVFQDNASGDAFKLFNRRSVVRGVAPALGEDLQSRVLPESVETRHVELPVGVRNISTMGIALAANDAADRFLAAHPEFVLSMHLPGAARRALIAARTCYRTTEDARVFFGCAFQWEQTPEAFLIIESLTNYMLDRIESAESATG